MDNGYKCLDLNPAFWRNGKAPSSIRYLRDGKNSRFRSQSKGARSQSRYGSMNRTQLGLNSKCGERPKSELAKDVEKIRVEQK